MRTEQEMLDVILGFARREERVRAVIMNGSRVNPNAPKDIFQDYDVVYMVTDMPAMLADRSWLKVFGELMIMQTPDEMGGSSAQQRDGFAFLMQFADGNRIDLTLHPADKAHTLTADSLSVLLLDKDGRFPPFPPPSDKDYLRQPPAAKEFADCCNEFWWVSTYVAKGLWREELPYAKAMLDQYVREALMNMLAWYAGMKKGWHLSPGKCGKYLEKLVEPELWHLFVQTYADGQYANIWDSLFAACGLFRRTALALADKYGLPYPHEDDRRVFAHLLHVRHLPKAVAEIYES